MSTGKKPTAGEKSKKPAKKPSSFVEFWKKLIRREKKKTPGATAPSERTLKRTVAKVAKNLHLKKEEQRQVATVLTAEVQTRALNKQSAPHRSTAQPSAGAAAFPVPVQTSFFPEQAEVEADVQVDLAPVALDVLKKKSASNLDARQKSFMEKSASMKGSSLTAPSMKTAKSASMAWPHQSYGSQPESITLDNQAVKEITSHTLVNMLQQLMIETAASVREAAKKPEDMNPDELVDLRGKSASSWDKLVRENTVVSYALTKPNDADVESGKKKKERKQGRKPLEFDSEVDVATAPTGKDFHANEKKSSSTSSLKKRFE